MKSHKVFKLYCCFKFWQDFRITPTYNYAYTYRSKKLKQKSEQLSLWDFNYYFKDCNFFLSLFLNTPNLALSVRNRNVLEEIWNYFRFPKLNFKNYTENSDKRYKIY